jgi:hypothetical protein
VLKRHPLGVIRCRGIGRFAAAWAAKATVEHVIFPNIKHTPLSRSEPVAAVAAGVANATATDSNRASTGTTGTSTVATGTIATSTIATGTIATGTTGTIATATSTARDRSVGDGCWQRRTACRRWWAVSSGVAHRVRAAITVCHVGLGCCLRHRGFPLLCQVWLHRCLRLDNIPLFLHWFDKVTGNVIVWFWRQL